jgi:hypothetical protein
MIRSSQCRSTTARFALWLAIDSSVCMLMGMDNIELYDAAVDGGAKHREEVA